MFRYFLILFTLLSISVQGQSTIQAEAGIQRKTKNWDTLKDPKFETVVIVGWISQYRTFRNEFDQTANKDTLNLSKHTYSTETDAAGSQGFVFNYDKFQLWLTWSPKPPDNNNGRGHTEVFNIGLNVGDNRWVSENYFRKFKGFYDDRTPNYDSTNFNKTKQYDLRPSMVSSLFMTRFMHFTNYKKFAYKSGFGCNYRQLKPAFSLIVGGSFSAFNLKNDSAIMPLQARYLYTDYGNMRGLSSLNISANFGVAGTFVILKAWFVNAYYTFGPEMQLRNYDLITNHSKKTFLGGSGTGRVSFGLNLKKFYFIGSYTDDRNSV
ncbi:MAG: DUF4421 family protein [Sphingobacteriaceae bacterium]|nr:DUF4421 family protein [Sphingobacteriaceae bacterium]